MACTGAPWGATRFALSWEQPSVTAMVNDILLLRNMSAVFVLDPDVGRLSVQSATGKIKSFQTPLIV